MACDGDFCDDFMELNPKDGGFKDLFHLLFSSNMDKNNLVKCPDETEIHEFKRRFLIFAAVVVQKALAAGTKPLAWFGATLEMWLNLLTHNQGFCRLLLNLVQGKLVIPDKSSATFESGLSHLDNRIDLDKDIKHGDSRYYGAFAIMAAKLSYENEAFVTRVVHENWKMELLGFYNFWNEFQEKPTTQAFMLRDRTGDTDLIVVAFRGTETFDSDAWSTDFDLSWYNLPEKGKIHGGFAKALGLQKKVVGLKETVEFPKEIEQGENRPQVAYYAIRQKLRELLRENDQAKFIVTGHSLGGALAALFPVILALHDEGELLERMEGVYTFGQPRIGDEQLGEFMKEQMTKHNVKYIRYVYGNDMVPRLPMDDKALLFKHFGTCIYYNSFFYQGQIVEEEPNKNYFSLLWAIPKMANAVWELVRSFIIRYKMGPEYRESWYLGAHRLIGILIPGVPAHAPFDYVNATRRGTLSLPVEESTHLLRQGPKAD